MNNKSDNLNNPSRRRFVQNSAAAFAGISILPSHVVSGLGYTAPSDKLNIAGIGVGGMGFANLKNLNTEKCCSPLRCRLEVCQTLL